jgi:type IV pilus assembly protein PilM
MPSGNGKGSSGISRLWRRFWMNPPLTWGCEISSTGVSLARWQTGSVGLEAAAWRPLSDGAVVVSPLHENVQRPEEVRQGLAACLESLGRGPRLSSPAGGADAALVIPDQAARLFFLNFDTLPHSAAEAIPLMRWKLKKSVPFDIDSSVISYLGRRHKGQWEVIAVVSPEGIIRQYEGVAESVGLKPRFVTLSTLASLGLIPASLDEGNGEGLPNGNESVLLAKYSPPWFTTAIVHDGSLCLFRTLSTGNAGTGLASLTEVLEAIYPSVAYFQDNFGAPLKQVFLCGMGENAGPIADSLSSELHLYTRPLVGDFGSPAHGWDRFQTERHLAALLGIVREQRHG